MLPIKSLPIMDASIKVVAVKTILQLLQSPETLSSIAQKTVLTFLVPTVPVHVLWYIYMYNVHVHVEISIIRMLLLV